MPEGRISSDRHALIAGGGIGGLSAALFLAQAGWRVTLCDREPALQEVGAGLQLSPNATRLVRDIGLLDDLDDIAIEPGKLIVRRAGDGGTLIKTNFGKPALERFGAPFLAVHRGDLHHALLRRVEANAAITLHLGHRLSDLRMEEDTVTGLFEVGDPKLGEPEIVRIKADVLIGADGVWSRARTLAGLPSPSQYTGKTAWRTLIPREQAPLFAREADVNLWLGTNAHLVHYPVCGGREINVVAIIEDEWREEGWSAPGAPEIIASRFRSWHRKAQELIGAAESWNKWALVVRASEHRWSRERMTLLGDAAHPMVPFLAQGASQAIEDAAVLARLLKDAAPDAIPARLKRYDAARISRTARVQREALRQAKIYHLSGLAARARDLALRLAPADMLLSRYDWIYGFHADAPENLGG